MDALNKKDTLNRNEESDTERSRGKRFKTAGKINITS